MWVHSVDCCNIDVSSWHKGSHNDSISSLQSHFNKHGAEVGAENIEQYLRKAVSFKQNLRGATKSSVAGATYGVIRYKKNGKYIDIAPDRTIFPLENIKDIFMINFDIYLENNIVGGLNFQI